MPPDYTTAMLMQDVMNTVETNLPPIIQVALYLAVVNFILGLVFYVLQRFSKSYKG